MSEKALVKKEAPALVQNEERGVEFIPFGASQSIRLSAAMVSAFIAVPTRSGQLPTERDCVRFIMLCQGKRANPFEGDCYLIGYDNYDKSGKLAGSTFSMVCGVELFLKRAEQSPDYDGYQAGIIVDAGNGPVEREGAMLYDGEKILGGWCKVYRKNRAFPTYKSVKFSTFDTGKSRWLKDPAGMIAKVAVSQAHREAYPTALGGLYSQEEMQRVAEAGGGEFEPLEAKSPTKALTDKYAKQAALPPAPPPEPPAPPKADPPPPPKEEPPAAPQEPQGAAEGTTPDGEDTPQFGDLDPNEPMVTGLIQSISYKDGKKKDGKPYTKWAVKIADVWYGTFDSTFAETAKQAKEMGKAVDLYYRESGQYKNITELVVSA